MNKKLFCVLFLLVVNACAQTVRYVSYNIGYDSNTGVNVTGINTGPWATIDYTQDGSNGLSSGYTNIYIDEGAYLEKITVDTYSGGGSVNYWFTYIGAPEKWGNTGAVIIDGGASRDYGFIVGKGSCAFFNLEVTGQYSASISAGISFNASPGRVERCVIHNGTGKIPTGIWLTNVWGSNIVCNNLIYNINATVAGGYAQGIWLNNYVGRCENNTIYNITQNSPQAGRGDGGVKIYYASAYSPLVLYVRNNIITNCEIDGQILINSNSGTEIDAFFTEGFEMDNNNYFKDGQTNVGSYDKSNQHGVTSYTTLANWQAALPVVVDRNSTDIDPKFVDKNLNWKLLGNSPSINTGIDTSVYVEDIDGIPRPKDNRWDKGAYEHDQVH